MNPQSPTLRRFVTLASLSVLALLLPATAHAAPSVDAAPPTPWGLHPWSGPIRAALETAGVTLPPHDAAALDELGAQLDRALLDLMTGQVPGTTIPFGLFVDANAEVCNGDGACGGTYMDNSGNTQQYYQQGNYATANTCNNSTTINYAFMSPGARQCSPTIEEKVCVNGNCEATTGQEFWSSPHVDPGGGVGSTDVVDVYVGIRRHVLNPPDGWPTGLPAHWEDCEQGNLCEG